MTVCPLCDRDTGIHDGVYGVHYDQVGAMRCPNSGQLVGPPVAETPPEVKPRKKAAPRKKAKP